jgi:hypothetical protein
LHLNEGRGGGGGMPGGRVLPGRGKNNAPVLGGQGLEEQDDEGQYYIGAGSSEYTPEKRLRDIQSALRYSQDLVYAQKNDIKGLNKQLSQVNAENDELRRLLAAAPKKKGKQEKDAYFYQIQNGIQAILKNKLFPSIKYLPNGWETYSEARNTVCGVIMSGVQQRPSNMIAEIYWRDVLVPYVNGAYVNMRMNLNQRIKKAYESKYCQLNNSYFIIYLQLTISAIS